jgi:hypothetical protein
VGSQEPFYVTDSTHRIHWVVTATLRQITDHAYWYVADGVAVEPQALQRAAATFEGRIIPTTRRLFGRLWTPGPDGDSHLTILVARGLGAAGYYSSTDEYPTLANPTSNQRKMIYMNADVAIPGEVTFDDILVHELQHAIHAGTDPNEDTWVNEGLSVLSESLHGYDVSPVVRAYQARPGIQLTTWGNDDTLAAHYGAAYLFLNYIVDRSSLSLLPRLLAEPRNGMAGITAALQSLGYTQTAQDLFSDWMVANVLRDDRIAEGHYAYGSMIPIGPEPMTTTAVITVHQFGPRYIDIRPQGPTTLTITATTTVPLLPTSPHSGQSMWWCNRGDVMDTTLTRSLDLQGVTSATLSYWTWYDLEDGWDYAYLMASVDGGQSWELLAGGLMTTSNPVGNNLGIGYTGQSGGQPAPTWVQDRVDLTPFTGRVILVRVECVTDDALNRPGLALDDIMVPEIGYLDEAEDANGWISNGFILSTNVIPQTITARLILMTNHERPTVLPLAFDGANQATYGIPGGVSRAIVAIAGTAPVTTEPAEVRLTLNHK